MLNILALRSHTRVEELHQKRFSDLDWMNNNQKFYYPVVGANTYPQPITQLPLNYGRAFQQSQLQYFPKPANRQKTTKYLSLKDALKLEYVTKEVIFSMNKTTIFTLIFGFMFLGCVFFLGGFLTATSIVKSESHQVVVHQPSTNIDVPRHMPSQTATLQGRPENDYYVRESQSANDSFSSGKRARYQ